MNGPDLRSSSGPGKRRLPEASDLVCPWCGQSHPIRLVRQLFPEVPPPEDAFREEASRDRSGGFVPGVTLASDPLSGAPGFAAPWSLELRDRLGADGRGLPDSPVPGLLEEPTRRAKKPDLDRL